MMMEPSPEVPVEFAERESTLVARLMLPPLEIAVSEPEPPFKELTEPVPEVAMLIDVPAALEMVTPPLPMILPGIVTLPPEVIEAVLEPALARVTLRALLP
jgi:hypothetical protein